MTRNRKYFTIIIINKINYISLLRTLVVESIQNCSFEKERLIDLRQKLPNTRQYHKSIETPLALKIRQDKKKKN